MGELLFDIYRSIPGHAVRRAAEAPRQGATRGWRRASPHVPERSSSPEAPNTPASSPRREDEDAGPTGEVKRKAEWVGNSLDLTLEDSQDDSPPESKDETRLSEASRSKGRDSTAVDEEWDETQPPERPPAEVPYAVPPVRQSYTGQSPPAEAPEPEQRPTRRHLVNAQPPRGDETDDGEDEEEDAPPSKRRRAADDTAAARVVCGRGRPAARAARPRVSADARRRAVSMLVEPETRVAASRPRPRRPAPAPSAVSRSRPGLSRPRWGGSGSPCARRSRRRLLPFGAWPGRPSRAPSTSAWKAAPGPVVPGLTRHAASAAATSTGSAFRVRRPQAAPISDMRPRRRRGRRPSPRSSGPRTG